MWLFSLYMMLDSLFLIMAWLQNFFQILGYIPLGSILLTIAAIGSASTTTLFFDECVAFLVFMSHSKQWTSLCFYFHWRISHCGKSGMLRSTSPPILPWYSFSIVQNGGMSCHVSSILMNEAEWLVLVFPVTFLMLFHHVRLPAVALLLYFCHTCFVGDFEVVALAVDQSSSTKESHFGVL